MRKTLLTARLVLSDITIADADLLFALDSDPEVMRYIGSQPSTDIQHYRDRTRDVYIPFQAHPWHGVRVVRDRTHEFLGWIFIRPAIASKHANALGWTDPHEVEIGYRFRRAVWGQGIATEAAQALMPLAFNDPETKTVVACARADNKSSLRVLAKLGLAVVGGVVLDGDIERTILLSRPCR